MTAVAEKRRFRVLAGQHFEVHPEDLHPKRVKVKEVVNGELVEKEVWVPPPEPPRTIIYRTGDVVESSCDLAKLFNGDHGSSPKFELVHENGVPMTRQEGPITPEEIARRGLTQANVPVQTVNDAKTITAAVSPMATLEHMTLDELRKHAAEEEIDLGKAKSKDEVLKVLRTAYNL